MTILTLDKAELEKRIGKITKELEERITSFGTPVEDNNDKEFSVEVFPNRPDLLSLENFARAINQFEGKEKLAKFEINEGDKNYVVKIEKEVKKVRPYTVCAIVKGLKLDEEKLKQLIDLQEKLHNSIGRKRRKLALGIYPLENITLPITFTAKKPEEIRFTPLGSLKEMNGNQILKNHDVGQEYAHLLDNFDLFPVFIDAKNKILSMPPIINSEETGRITTSTKDVFIECSGSNLPYLKKCLNILIAGIYPMGGKVYSMRIKDSSEKEFITPDMSFEKLEFKISDIEKTLGIKLSEKEIKKFFERMGIGYENNFALIPPYRTDILHWIDLSEEVAIAYGYDNFEAEIPKISTIASEDQEEKMKRVVCEILTNIGLNEISSFHLTTKDNIKNMHYEFNEFLEVEDSKNERNVLRMDLLTNILQVFSENSDSSYPQKIFEIGRVFSKDKKASSETGIEEIEKIAVGLSGENVNFTEIKQILDNLFRMVDKEYNLEVVEDNNFIIGRVGKVLIDGKDIGRIGEIAPRVLKNWGIKNPVVAFEINLENFIR